MEILSDYSLKNHNTFGIDVNAKYFVELENESDIDELTKNHLYHTEERMILGEGSDVLFTKDFEGLVVLNRIKGIDKIKEDSDLVFIKAKGGENWHELVRYTVGNNWYGIENLSLIPGTVGAAPMQNIGAYGVELKDTLVELEAIDLSTGIIKVFCNEDCQFDYRESIFKNNLKGKYLISSITLKLSKKPIFHLKYAGIKEKLEEMDLDKNAKNISDAIVSIRESKLPYPEEIGNAGSFFKNPVIPNDKLEELKEEFPDIKYFEVDENNSKVPAGWLIEQCGWKGKKIGNTGTYKNQALVLVNYGNASGQEIYFLAKKIQESVYEKFDIEIIPEVNIY
jgi:UDP-N-acetylmuramate dehydrogenase